LLKYFRIPDSIDKLTAVKPIVYKVGQLTACRSNLGVQDASTWLPAFSLKETDNIYSGSVRCKLLSYITAVSSQQKGYDWTPFPLPICNLRHRAINAGCKEAEAKAGSSSCRQYCYTVPVVQTQTRFPAV